MDDIVYMEKCLGEGKRFLYGDLICIIHCPITYLTFMPTVYAL